MLTERKVSFKMSDMAHNMKLLKRLQYSKRCYIYIGH
jgi:hypothetical protein